MENTKIKIYEAYQLKGELNGKDNSETQQPSVKGMLDENLGLVLKYHLNNLSTKINEIVSNSENLKNELIKKYGKKDKEGNYSIEQLIDGSVNPKLLKFNEEFNALISSEVELEHHNFKLDDFAKVTTSTAYNVLFKLMKV